jgi:hypothetical protein
MQEPQAIRELLRLPPKTPVPNSLRSPTSPTPHSTDFLAFPAFPSIIFFLCPN